MRRRAKEMRIEFLYEALPGENSRLRRNSETHRSNRRRSCLCGRRLPDFPVMHRVGLAVAVGDATPEIKRAAHFVTKAPGGRGAIRESIELIMKSKGIWEKMLEKARA